jgi:L-lactate permease
VVTVVRSIVLTALAYAIAFAHTAPTSLRTSIEGLVVGLAVLGWVVLGSQASRMLHFNTHLRAIGGR